MWRRFLTILEIFFLGTDNTTGNFFLVRTHLKCTRIWVLETVIGRLVYEPSVILCSPACFWVCNDKDNFWACTKKAHQGWSEWEGVGVLTKLIYFCEHYNDLPLYFITNSSLLLSCFSVGFLYILVQKLIFLILTHNSKNSVENVYILVTKGQSGSNCIPTQNWEWANDHISPLWWHNQL